MSDGDFFYGLSLRRTINLDYDLSLKHLWKPVLNTDKVFTPVEKYLNKWTRVRGINKV